MKSLFIRLVLSLVLALAVLYLLGSSRHAEPTVSVVVKTLQITNISTTTADCIFSVEDPEHLPKTPGVCIGKAANPTTAGTKSGLAKATQGPVKFRSTMYDPTPLYPVK